MPKPMWPVGAACQLRIDRCTELSAPGLKVAELFDPVKDAAQSCSNGPTPLRPMAREFLGYSESSRSPGEAGLPALAVDRAKFVTYRRAPR